MYKKYILRIVKDCFETGHVCIKCEDFKNSEDYNQALNLLNLGPVGFYQEFKDELHFDSMFIEEYGKEEY